MKRYITYVVCVLLSIPVMNAQLGAKKSAIQSTYNQALNLGDVYSVKKQNHSQPNYVVSKSDVQIPISYESYSYTEIPMKNINYMYSTETVQEFNYKRFTDEGLPLTQTFNVFTIIDTNNLNVEGNTDEIVSLEPDAQKYLPQDFNPFKGMFLDKVNSKYLSHPVTAR